MAIKEATPERVGAFSDGVFAIVITNLVLDLHPPRSADASELIELWPRGLSYLFLAIVWVTHHYLLRHADLVTPRLQWRNFAHLFTVSLVPFSTAWIAATHLGAEPVGFYAGIFVLVNATYLMLLWDALDKPKTEISPRMRKVLQMRSFSTLAVFALSAIIALKYSVVGKALICACLLLYLRPQKVGIRTGVRKGPSSSCSRFELWRHALS
jgi:uncharacterized membrane protein